MLIYIIFNFHIFIGKVKHDKQLRLLILPELGPKLHFDQWATNRSSLLDITWLLIYCHSATKENSELWIPALNPPKEHAVGWGNSRMMRTQNRKVQLLLINSLTFGLEVCLAAGVTYVPPLLLEIGVEEKFMTMVLGRWLLFFFAGRFSMLDLIDFEFSVWKCRCVCLSVHQWRP